MSKSLSQLAVLGLLTLAIPVTAQPGGAGPRGQGGPGAPGGPGMARAERPFAGPERPGLMKSRVLAHLAQGQFGKRHGQLSGKMLLLPPVREKLGITDDQAKKIEDLAYNTEKQAIDLAAKVKGAELDLKQSMKQKRPDRNKALGQLDAVAKAKSDLAKLKLQERLSVRELLTDQQIDKIEQFIKTRHGGQKGPMAERRHERFGRRGPRGPHGFMGGRGGFGEHSGFMSGREGLGGPQQDAKGGPRGFMGGRGGFGGGPQGMMGERGGADGPQQGVMGRRGGFGGEGGQVGPMIRERIQQRIEGMRGGMRGDMQQPDGKRQPDQQSAPGEPAGRGRRPAPQQNPEQRQPAPAPEGHRPAPTTQF